MSLAVWQRADDQIFFFLDSGLRLLIPLHLHHPVSIFTHSFLHRLVELPIASVRQLKLDGIANVHIGSN